MVSLDTVKNDLNQYVYKVSNAKILFNNGDTIDIPPININKIIIDNKYFEAKFPSIMMSILLTKGNYIKVLKGMNDIIVSFTINMYNAGAVKTNSDFDKNTSQYNAFQLIKVSDYLLKPINQDMLNTLIPNLVNENDDSSYDYNSTNDMESMTLYLYDFTLIKKYRESKSYIVTGGLNDCLYRVFKDRGMKNVLCNYTKSNEVKTYVMKYGHLGDNLDSLNEYYGIYDYPFMLYLDTNRIYMLDMSQIGKTLESDEKGSVIIYLTKFDSSLNCKTGSYEDNNLYGLITSSFNVNDLDSSMDYANCGAIRSVNLKNGEVYYTKLTEADVYNEKYHSVNSKKHHTQLVWNSIVNRRTISLAFQYANALMFTPNKLFTIIADDSFYSKDYKLNGSYFLSSSYFVYTREGDDSMKLSVQANLSQVINGIDESIDTHLKEEKINIPERKL